MWRPLSSQTEENEEKGECQAVGFIACHKPRNKLNIYGNKRLSQGHMFGIYCIYLCVMREFKYFPPKNSLKWSFLSSLHFTILFKLIVSLSGMLLPVKCRGVTWNAFHFLSNRFEWNFYNTRFFYFPCDFVNPTEDRVILYQSRRGGDYWIYSSVGWSANKRRSKKIRNKYYE